MAIVLDSGKHTIRRPREKLPTGIRMATDLGESRQSVTQCFDLEDSILLGACVIVIYE
jgi:hypothetical protein